MDLFILDTQDKNYLNLDHNFPTLAIGQLFRKEGFIEVFTFCKPALSANPNPRVGAAWDYRSFRSNEVLNKLYVMMEID